MDVALAIEALLPAAEYFGSTTDNTKKCFDDLNWLDERPKPTWKEIQDAFKTVEIKQSTQAADKAAILERIGLTADELKTILG
jgi:hypothetical protein